MTFELVSLPFYRWCRLLLTQLQEKKNRIPLRKADYIKWAKASSYELQFTLIDIFFFFDSKKNKNRLQSRLKLEYIIRFAWLLFVVYIYFLSMIMFIYSDSFNIFIFLLYVSSSSFRIDKRNITIKCKITVYRPLSKRIESRMNKKKNRRSSLFNWWGRIIFINDYNHRQ